MIRTGEYWYSCFLILLTKVFASSATNAGGGCGGIFAPSLYLGCISGFLFAHASNYFPFTMYISEKNFALLGMAGIMSGVMHAPLTGVFLIAELTGGYDLFLPLMIVSISSYLTILMFEPHSIYSMRLAQKGELLTHHKDRAVLTLLNTDSVIEKDFQVVSPEMSLGDMATVIAKSGRNSFPVVDEKGVLLGGSCLLDNIRNVCVSVPELPVTGLPMYPSSSVSAPAGVCCRDVPDGANHRGFSMIRRPGTFPWWMKKDVMSALCRNRRYLIHTAKYW